MINQDRPQYRILQDRAKQQCCSQRCYVITGNRKRTGFRQLINVDARLSKKTRQCSLNTESVDPLPVAVLH